MNSIYDELRIVLHGIWTRRWLALAIAWGICLLGWLVVALIPSSYQSVARVLVEQTQVLPSEAANNPGDQQKKMDQLRQTLTSQENLETVVRGTELGKGLSDAAISARAAGLREKIQVMALQDNLFQISVLWSDSSMSEGANARMSAAIVGKLLDIFLQGNRAGDRDQTQQALKFLDQQIQERGAQLQQAEQRLAEFENKYASVLPGTGSISDRMAAGRAEISQIDSQLIAAQSAMSAINAQLASTPATLAAGGGGNSALGTAQAELASMRARGWTDQHPDVIVQKNQIANMRSMSGGGGGGTQTPNPMYMSVRALAAERQATVNALQTRKAQLQNELNRIVAAQASDPAVAGEQGAISRNYQVLKDQYDKLLADRENVKLKGQVQDEGANLRFNVVDPPSVPSAPTSPNRPLLLAAVLIVGLGAGVAGAFVLGHLKTTYPTAERLERASGLPVLGSITETLNANQRAIRGQRQRWFVGATGGLFGLCLLLVAVEFVQRGMIA